MLTKKTFRRFGTEGARVEDKQASWCKGKERCYIVGRTCESDQRQKLSTVVLSIPGDS